MNDLLSRTFSSGRPRTYVDLKKDVFREMEEGGASETEMTGTSAERSLEIFFHEVEDIKNKMDKVKQLLMKLQDAHEESKTVHKAQTMKALRDRMDSYVDEVLKLAKSLKNKLEDLDRSNAANRRLRGCEEGTSTERTRSSVTNTQRKKLKDLMGEFQLLRQKMVGEYRETIERRYYTVTGQHPDDETIEKIIDTGESETFLQKAIQEQGRGQVIETIREIQERHDAVKEIEKNLLELHQIFLDMAVLVEAQGEHLNTIEEQVNRASSFVITGTSNLQTAKKHQRNTRKWMCIGIIVLLVVILIIVLPIVASLKKKKN